MKTTPYQFFIGILIFTSLTVAQVFIPFSYWTSMNKPIVLDQCPATQTGTLNISLNYGDYDATSCSFSGSNAAFTGTGGCSCAVGICNVTGLTFTQTYLASMTVGVNNYITNGVSYTITRPSGVYSRLQDILVKTGTWTPRCMGTSLLMWLDSTDATTVFQDVAGLTPATSGTTVALWNDKSGNAFNATQGTAANRPVYVNGVNTALRFSNNWASVFTFMTSSITMSGTTGFNGAVGSMFSVVNATSTGGNSNISVAGFRNGGGNFTGFSTPNATTWGMDWWTNNIYTWNTGATIVTGANAVMGFTNASGAQLFSLNGTTYTNTVATTTITNNATTLMIANDNCCGNTRYFNGNISELLAIKLNLQTSYRRQLEGYLAWKYGISGSLPVSHTYKSFTP